MLVVLLKKQIIYNTKVGETDTKIWTLDGKITENKNNLKELAKNFMLFSGEI